MIKHTYFLVFSLFAVSLAQVADISDYDVWKRSLGGGDKSGLLLGPIFNNWVAVQLDNTDTGEKGCFNIGTSPAYTPAPGRMLLYSYPWDPWSSHAVFKVDGRDYGYQDVLSGHTGYTVLSDPTVPFSIVPMPHDSTYIIGGWDINSYGGPPVRILQMLQPVIVWNAMGDTTGTIYIKYIIINNDVTTHCVGVSLEMDTDVDGHDDARIASAFGYENTWQFFDVVQTGIPAYWKAAPGDPPWTGPVVAQGILRGWNAVEPETFIIGGWGTLYSGFVWFDSTVLDPYLCWPSEGPGCGDADSYSDSGVRINWTPRCLMPGETTYVATYMGLALPDRTPTRAYLVVPPDGFVSACSDQRIVIVLVNPDGIDRTTIRLYINGTPILWGDPRLTFTRNILTFTPPPGFFHDGENVIISVQAADPTMVRDSILWPLPQWQFSLDLEGPQVTSISVSPGDSVYNLWQPISFVVEDNYTGIDTASFLVGIVGAIYGTHTAVMGSAELIWNSATNTLLFDPSGGGRPYPYDDSIYIGVARCFDRTFGDTFLVVTYAIDTAEMNTDTLYANFCGPNDIQPNGVWFFTPDDDTVPPSVLDFSPSVAMEMTPFDITVVFHDESGVDTCSPSGIYPGGVPYIGQEPYILWDTDGEVDIDYAGRINLTMVAPMTFITSSQIPPQPGGTRVTFKVFAYDDDHDRGKFYDALPLRENIQYVQISMVPQAFLVDPPPLATVACVNQMIKIWLPCSTEIVPESLVLTFNGVTYRNGRISPLSYANDTLFFVPTATNPVIHGTNTMHLAGLYDEFGTHGAECDWTLFGDLRPPYIFNTSPSAGQPVNEMSFDVCFSIDDQSAPVPQSITGLDPSSIRVWIVSGQVYDVNTSFVIWDGTRFCFNTGDANLSFLDGQTVVVHVHAVDKADSNYCGPNVMDTIFSFRMSEMPCWRGTNPITPNNDAYNDYTTFKFPNMRSVTLDQKIYIYDRYNNLVRTIEEPSPDFGGWAWDGRDENGKVVPQGVYVYVIVVDNQAVCNGTISVAR